MSEVPLYRPPARRAVRRPLPGEDGTPYTGEFIFIEPMTSNRKLKASRDGSKWRIYGA